MNDLGLPANNFVMKATHISTAEGNQADTVKLSDDEGKHTGPTEKVLRYQAERNRRIGCVAAHHTVAA